MVRTDIVYSFSTKNMNKSRVIICMLLQLCIFQAKADEQMLHVILKTGNHISLSVAEQPKIVFENGVMSVGNEDILACNVLKYVIGTDDLLSINDHAKEILFIDGNEVVHGYVRVCNYNGQKVRIYSPDGIEMPCRVIISDDEARIDYSWLPAGTYILCVGEDKFKIQKL